MRTDLPIIVMSAQPTFITAIKASERGAYEYLPKPFDLRELVAIFGRALAEPKRRREEPEAGPVEVMPIVGRSQAMQDIFRILARLMQTDLTVMISGESGTGKELVAKALHDYGKRKGGPFVAINMAAIPRDLIESELFGHEKGAFTGAAARSAIQQGTFREDLFFRLNVVPIRLPPLRERPEDIPDLVRAFFQRNSSEGLPVKTFQPAAMDRLRRYPWPGNVRELENLTRRLAALYPQDVIGEHLIETELNAGALPLFPPSAGGEDG